MLTALSLLGREVVDEIVVSGLRIFEGTNSMIIRGFGPK